MLNIAGAGDVFEKRYKYFCLFYGKNILLFFDVYYYIFQ